MRKKDLLQALEGLDDDALIYVQTAPLDESEQYYFIQGFTDKITGDDVENEITLQARQGV